jgi:hypothetical protein
MTTFHVKQCYYPNVDKETVVVSDLFRAGIAQARTSSRKRERISSRREHVEAAHAREKNIFVCSSDVIPSIWSIDFNLTTSQLRQDNRTSCSTYYRVSEKCGINYIMWNI